MYIRCIFIVYQYMYNSLYFDIINSMKRLLAYLFIVFGLGLVFFGSTFVATEKNLGINVFNPETASEPKLLDEEKEKKSGIQTQNICFMYK